jgi:hypothetical protein
LSLAKSALWLISVGASGGQLLWPKILNIIFEISAILFGMVARGLVISTPMFLPLIFYDNRAYFPVSSPVCVYTLNVGALISNSNFHMA